MSLVPKLQTEGLILVVPYILCLLKCCKYRKIPNDLKEIRRLGGKFRLSLAIRFNKLAEKVLEWHAQ